MLLELTAEDPDVKRVDFSIRTSHGTIRRKVLRSPRLSDAERIDQFHFMLSQAEVEDLHDIRFKVVGKTGTNPIRLTISVPQSVAHPLVQQAGTNG